MGSTGGDCIKIAPSDAAGCSETTVEIKIKTLDSETFTLRVDKRVPVPELKEQIASVTGVLSEQQRLICRGKVLKDDQLLSAYHVEDGHTLHMIVRQPVAPSPELSDHPASDPASSAGNSPGSRVGPGMLVGTFNISEQGDGAFPDLNRIVSAVLNSFGVSRFGSGSEGIDLNQPPLERLSSLTGLRVGSRNYSRQHADQAASTHVPVEPLQPPIIPDSLTTLSQYLTHLRQEFVASAGGHSANAQSADLESEASVQNSEARGLLTPEALAEVMSSTRQLLVEQATECLSQFATQLESHSSVADPLERSRIQSNALRSGALFQNLGALLLELGRTMMTLRMGQSSSDALVNAGPAVFISSTGPNPIMVQPLPFQPGASFGSVPVGTVQHGSGLSGASAAGTGFLPRNIDIRIRTGSMFPRREQSSSQPQGEAAAASSNNVNSTSNQQESAAAEANPRSREPQVRAIPIRTVVAAVPASVARNSDSSRGSIGILYPVLARVQHMSSGNSNGTTSQAMDVDQLHDPNGGNSEQPGPDSSAQQNAAVPGGNGNNGLPSEALNGQEFTAQIRGGLEHLLSSIFPGEHILSHTEPTQESGSAVSDQGLMLSNILRHIIPIVSENTGAESNGPTSGGSNPDETQTDGNPGRGASSRRRRGPQTHPNSKRPRREQ